MSTLIETLSNSDILFYQHSFTSRNDVSAVRQQVNT